MPSLSSTLTSAHSIAFNKLNRRPSLINHTTTFQINTFKMPARGQVDWEQVATWERLTASIYATGIKVSKTPVL